MSQVIIHKKICVKISSKVQLVDEIAYYWSVYRSLLFHVLLWSVNHCNSGCIVFIEIGTEEVEEGKVREGIESHQSTGEGDTDSDKQQYLLTHVYF